MIALDTMRANVFHAPQEFHVDLTCVVSASLVDFYDGNDNLLQADATVNEALAGTGQRKSPEG